MSHSKPHTFQRIEQLHDVAIGENLKLAPEKSFLIIFTVKHLGTEIGFKTTKQTQLKIGAIHKIPSPTTKIELLRFICLMNFLSENTDKRHLNVKPLYDFFVIKIELHWKF